jgi:hypothetical protein
VGPGTPCGHTHSSYVAWKTTDFQQSCAAADGNNMWKFLDRKWKQPRLGSMVDK